MLYAEVGRELLLEGTHLRAEDVATRACDADDRLGEAIVVGMQAAGEEWYGGHSGDRYPTSLARVRLDHGSDRRGGG
jgi:hypothetical protein